MVTSEMEKASVRMASRLIALMRIDRRRIGTAA
jgi:hypothetical protein